MGKLLSKGRPDETMKEDRNRSCRYNESNPKRGNYNPKEAADVIACCGWSGERRDDDDIYKT
jgi:hypothetical protein